MTRKGDSPAIEIDLGDPSDPEVAALVEASHVLMEALFPPEDNHYLSVEELRAPNIDLLVARLDGRAVGCVALADQGTYGEVKSMFVAPEARGRGVGAMLMDRIEDMARARGMESLMLETGDLLHEAHRLYGRKGFSVRGPFGDYTENSSSIFMEKRLR